MRWVGSSAHGGTGEIGMEGRFISKLIRGHFSFGIQGLQKELNYRAFCREAFIKLQRLATAKNLKLAKTHIHHGNTMAIAQVEMLGWLMPDSDRKIDLQSTLQRLKAAGEVIQNLQAFGRSTDGGEPGSR